MERYPRTFLTCVMESGEDEERAGLIARRALSSRPRLRGIHLASAGAGPVVAALRRLGRSESTVLA